MQNTEKQKFEESWKSAFDGAEMTPPDGVWSSIELDLVGQESAAMKKRVVFYQRLAAALLLCSLMTGIYAFYPRNEEVQLTTKKEDSKVDNTIVSEKSITTIPSPTATKSSIVIKKEEQPVLLALAEPTVIEESEEVTETKITEEKPKEEKLKEEKPKEETVAVVSPLLQQTEQPEEVVQPKRKSRENNLWLALGASAGNYSPNTPTANTTPQNSFAGTMANLATQPQPKSQPKVGSSYSFGMAVGKKFGRVVIQTGINVGKQQVEYSSNYDVRTPSNSAKAASADYLSSESQSYAMTFTNTTYTVNSTMEIISIPVQAGYMIIDRKLGWQMNAGVSPDFFLRNVLEDESGKRERFTQSAGSESPYRSVNWSGLLNTELSYRVGQHYRLSLVPGVRYSFNSILKEPTNSGRPVILDLGFRFRYLFD